MHASGTAFKIDDTQQSGNAEARRDRGTNAAGVTKGKRMVELMTVGRDRIRRAYVSERVPPFNRRQSLASASSVAA